MTAAPLRVRSSLQRLSHCGFRQHPTPLLTRSYCDLRTRQTNQFTASFHGRNLSSLSSSASTLTPASSPLRGNSLLVDLKRSCVGARSFRNEAASPVRAVPKFAFAFEILTPTSIDGVLYRSGKPFKGALKALQMLHQHRIPFILLTNGGGKHEVERTMELSKKFGIDLTVDNFVQSHTPFQEMAVGSELHQPLHDKTVLVTGGNQDKIREIAHRYGFKHVVTPGDILRAQPNIWPFNEIWTDYYKTSYKPLPEHIDFSEPSKSLKFDAVFVYNDPRDWALDIQIITDLLMSKNGVLGTLSEKNGDKSLPNNGWQQDGQPAVIFSNPDLYWSTNYHQPRFGQGGFRSALEGVWTEITGGANLQRTVIGKPHKETYQYAERVLRSHRQELLGGAARSKVPDLDRVFMIGDNPESDIRGANEFKSPDGTEWTSVLVKTGVWREGTVPTYEPKMVVDDVLAAVKWALKQEGYIYTEKDFELA